MGNGRRFELIRELGAGAFGTVYLAAMVSAGDFRKRVALKLLNSQWDPSGDAGARLRDEARLLGQLRHRHIVQVDDLVLLDGRWAVVMEHIPGADLERVLQAAERVRSPLPPPASLEIAAAVASALDAAWSGRAHGDEPLRVIHRDIKPSNIRLTADGDVKVLDFGIARAQFSSREARTEQVRYGSLGYMAPERLLGEEDTPAGDVYAVGCVMVETLTGRPFGRSALLPDQQRAQVEEALREVEAALEDDALPVIELIRQTMAYDADQRPGASELAERARRLSRTLSGEDLPDYCRRFVPTVASLLGDDGKPVNGVLSEATTASPAGVSPNTTMMVPVAPGGTEAAVQPALVSETRTLLTPAQSDRGARSDTTTIDLEADLGPPRRPIGAIVGGVVGVLLIAGAALWLLSPGTDVPPAAPEVAAPVEAAPVEAAPVEAAPAEAAPAEAAPTEATAAPAEASSATKAASTTGASSARSTSASGSATAKTAAPEASGQPSAAAASSGAETLRAVKFAVTNASSVTATCGGVQGTGIGSALLREVPAGACTVSATIDGASYTGRLTVDRPMGVTCTLEGGALACR